MPQGPVSPKELGFYFSVAQVGLEMVFPVGIGLVLDHYLHWTPWGVVVGAVLGLLLGLVHLIALTNQRNKSGPGGPRQDRP
jgi:F0F1-type ATP synthase assembly protein I